MFTEIDDHRLVEAVARTVSVPRATVTGDSSFVLHAPLELLARAALLPHVAPSERERARRLIVELGGSYEKSGPPLGPPSPLDVGTAEAAAAALGSALDDGDLDTADAAATWLGENAPPDRIVHLLAPSVLDRLSAAGHGNIYLALLARTQPRGLPGQMLRHPVRALAGDPCRRIRLPRRTLVRDDDAVDALLAEALAELTPVGPPPTWGIAALVEHAAAEGVLDRFLAADGTFVAPRRVPYALQRVAAQTMLQGPPEQAPYGWSHCLTLAQAPLLLAASGADVGAATFVAVAYVAAHWAGHGVGTLDPAHVPEPGGARLPEALHESPRAAAAAAWHETDTSHTVSLLATLAATHHDAHLVKYTLACLDATATDPAASRLYLAAAAHLIAWWAPRG